MRMINEDVRPIVEGALRSGEELLWAESVSAELRQKWIDEQIKSSRIWGVFLLLFGAFLIWNNSFSSHESFDFFGISVGVVCVLASLLCMRAYVTPEAYHKRRAYKFYAITNLRLLYFDLEQKLSEELEAPGLKKVSLYKVLGNNFKWKPTCLTLAPISSRLFGFAEIYFLENYEKPRDQIASILKGEKS